MFYSGYRYPYMMYRRFYPSYWHPYMRPYFGVYQGQFQNANQQLVNTGTMSGVTQTIAQSNLLV